MRSLSFSEAVVCNYSIKMFLIKFCQSLLATSLKKETLRQVHFCELCKIPKIRYLAEHLQMGDSRFCTLSYVSLDISFHQAEQ